MTVLGLETSGRVLSVALGTPDGNWEFAASRNFNHVEDVMPAVLALTDAAGLAPADLDLVACSAGPGSFTGLRIGMATAKGLARGAGCALKAVPTLELMAMGREHWPGPVVAMLDARKGRVYAAVFEGGKQIGPDADIAMDSLFSTLDEDASILVTGTGAPMAASRPNVVIDPLHAAGRAPFLIDSALRHFEAEGSDPHDLGPTYLRASEAEMTSKRMG